MWGGGGWVFFFNDTATTEIYTRSLVGSVKMCIRDRWGCADRVVLARCVNWVEWDDCLDGGGSVY